MEHANSNQKKQAYNIKKVDFKTRTINRDKEDIVKS